MIFYHAQEHHYLFYWTDVVNIALGMSYVFCSHNPSVAGALLFGLFYGLRIFSHMACFYYLFEEEVLECVQKIIACVSRIFSSNPRVSALNSF